MAEDRLLITNTDREEERNPHVIIRSNGRYLSLSFIVPELGQSFESNASVQLSEVSPGDLGLVPEPFPMLSSFFLPPYTRMMLYT